MTDFGVTISKRLLDMNRTQAWLIDALRAATGQYVDTSLMHKLKTGKVKSPSLQKAIRKILDIAEDGQAPGPRA
jgi:hypothetical protein